MEEERRTYKDLEQEADKSFNEDIRVEGITKIKEKKQEIRVAERILKKLRKQYVDLLEKEIY